MKKIILPLVIVAQIVLLLNFKNVVSEDREDPKKYFTYDEFVTAAMRPFFKTELWDFLQLNHFVFIFNLFTSFVSLRDLEMDSEISEIYNSLFAIQTAWKIAAWKIKC